MSAYESGESENVVQELGPEESGESGEAGDEAGESLVSPRPGQLAGSPHAPVSYTIPKSPTPKKPKAGGEGGEGGEGGADVEDEEGGESEGGEGFSVSYEAGEESEEAGESQFETVEGWDESAGTEAAQEAADTEATVDAWYAGATAKDQKEFFQFLAPLLLPVVKAAIPALAGAAAQNLPKLAGAILGRIGKRRRPGRRREAGEEGGVDEAALEAMAQQLEIIIGSDDRVQITNTKVVPWKRICHLRIEAANGKAFLGTGALISPRTIVTAGHCVYMRDAGGWARSITVTPGRNGTSEPFGKCKAVKLWSVRGWTVQNKREYDYGAIIVPRGCFKMQPPSAFGFAAYSDAFLKNKKLNIAGYPGDKPPGTMWYHGRKAKTILPQILVYDIDTVGGQSGSPVWIRAGGTRTMVGIHTNGAPSGNSATRITAPVLKNLKKWRQEGS